MVNQYNEPISLFDYLGYPAGKELGERVNKYAKSIHASLKFRAIDIPSYKGIVMLYDRSLLDAYFKVLNKN